MMDQDQIAISPDMERILAERAQALARSLEDEPVGEHIDLVVLTLGAERYGVDVHYVEEIRPLDALTPVPGAPRIWAGVVNLRGHLYPILNLRRYLEQEGEGALESDSVVLVTAAGLTVGLLADGMCEVRRVPRTEIAPSLADVAGMRHAIVLGVTADWITLLDVAALLTDPRLVIQEEAH
jgi:purine-binding chemotaxis protein CheW